MADIHAPITTPRDLLRTLKAQPGRWLVPMILSTVAALVFALVRPRVWEAQQALLVRDEVSIEAQRSVSSTRADEIKAAQETIMELAHSQQVLKSTLAEVGPSSYRKRSDPFPSGEDVEELAEMVALVPPKGGEFGKTDIFYLKVKDRDRQRALTLAHVLSQQTQNGYEDLRQTKANSAIRELEKTVQLARRELDSSTTKLAELEKQVGGTDLGELRIMNEMPSGMSDLRNEATALEQEIRKEISDRMQNEQLLTILRGAMVDPGELLACPNNLLSAQPGLRRLKEGLVDAQLRRATMLGSMSQQHPQVLAAERAEQEIGQNLHDELEIAVKGIDANLKLSSDRLATLEERKARLNGRFNRLAEIRAAYGNLATMTKHRGEILKTAEQELAAARSKLAASHNGSLLQILGEPVTGTHRVGPGNTVIVLAGMAGGLLIGLGLAVLATQPVPFEPQLAQTVFETNEAGYKIPQPRESHRPTDEEVPAPSEPPTTPPMIEPQSAPSVAVAPATISSASNTLTFGQALQRINQSRSTR